MTAGWALPAPGWGKGPEIAAWCLQEVLWPTDSKGNTTASSQLQFLSLTASLDAHPKACDIAFGAWIFMLLRAR